VSRWISIMVGMSAPAIEPDRKSPRLRKGPGVPSRANDSKHWRAEAELVRRQRRRTRERLAEEVQPGRLTRPRLPVTVRLVRVSSNTLDKGDNLSASLKAIRDEVCDWLGLPNDRDERARWRYGQARPTLAGVVESKGLDAPKPSLKGWQGVRIQILEGHETCACGAPLMNGRYL